MAVTVKTVTKLFFLNTSAETHNYLAQGIGLKPDKIQSKSIWKGKPANKLSGRLYLITSLLVLSSPQPQPGRLL